MQFKDEAFSYYLTGETDAEFIIRTKKLFSRISNSK